MGKKATQQTPKKLCPPVLTFDPMFASLTWENILTPNQVVPDESWMTVSPGYWNQKLKMKCYQTVGAQHNFLFVLFVCLFNLMSNGLDLILGLQLPL